MAYNGTSGQDVYDQNLIFLPSVRECTGFDFKPYGRYEGGEQYDYYKQDPKNRIKYYGDNPVEYYTRSGASRNCEYIEADGTYACHGSGTKKLGIAPAFCI